MLNDFFYNDWLDYHTVLNSDRRVKFTVNLPASFFSELKFDKKNLKQYAIDAAINCSKNLGSKIAICLSGGLDSQFAVQAFRAANINFDTLICRFENDLNNHDTDHAIRFCTEKNIPFHIIDFKVIQFLNTKNFEVGCKYKSASPQFNVHYEFFNILKSKGYTGIVCGGIYPYKSNNNWGNNLALNTFNFINYALVENIYVQGSFLSYCPKLSWSLGIITPSMDRIETTLKSLDLYEKYHYERYLHKIKAYDQFDFDLIPQENKFTGFEKVKLHYEKITGDGWFFEKNFRHNLQNLFQEKLENDKILHLTVEQDNILSQIQSDYMLTSL